MSFFRRFGAMVLVSVCTLAGTVAHADGTAPAPSASDDPYDRPNIPDELLDVGVDEKLDSEVPKDTIFKDESGKAVRLGDIVSETKPTMLILAYHKCPVLCGLVQNAALDAMKQIGWTAGKEYDVVTLSIDPRDTVSDAAEKRTAMLASYGRSEANQGWHFLVGDDQNIQRVAAAIGWKYHYDARQGQYAHPSAITLLKPGGRVARYLYGIEFAPNDLKLGLLEASEGKSISTVERVVLYCYHYDPQDRKYSLVAMHVMQIGGGVTLVAMGTFLGVLWLAEKRKKGGGEGPKKGSSTSTPSSTPPTAPSARSALSA